MDPAYHRSTDLNVLSLLHRSHFHLPLALVFQLRHLATMFEEAEDMVDYASLVAFASEQPAALRAASAVSRLRNHLVSLRNSRGIDLRATLEVFAVRDGGGGNGGGAGGGGGRAVLRQPQLEDALRELGLS